MTRAVIVFENDDKILLLPDGQRIRPEWNEVSLRYSSDLSRLELVDMSPVPPRVVGCIYNLKLIVRFIQAKHFYAGWLGDQGQIEQMPIKMDFSSLLP